jgi:hypothetical protein
VENTSITQIAFRNHDDSDKGFLPNPVPAWFNGFTVKGKKK